MVKVEMKKELIGFEYSIWYMLLDEMGFNVVYEFTTQTPVRFLMEGLSN